MSFLVFAVEQLYALDIELVERVLRAVEIRPLPSGPAFLAGLLNVRGSVLPVVDLRLRFGLPKRSPRLDDCLVLVKIPRPLALRVDAIHEIISRAPEEITSVEAMMPQTNYFEGVTKLDDEILLIQDLGRLLSLEETNAIDEAIARDPEASQ